MPEPITFREPLNDDEVNLVRGLFHEQAVLTALVEHHGTNLEGDMDRRRMNAVREEAIDQARVRVVALGKYISHRMPAGEGQSA